MAKKSKENNDISSTTDLTSENLEFKNLFELSPIAYWEEDLSGIKNLLIKLKERGIKDIDTYINKNPEFVEKCAKEIKVLNINNAAVKLHKANNKEHFLKDRPKTLNKKSIEVLKKELIAFANNEKVFSEQTELHNFDGEIIDVHINIFTLENKKNDLSRVIVSFTDLKKIDENNKTLYKKLDNKNKELLISRERFKKLSDLTFEGILIHKKGIILEINKAFSEITGFTKENLIGKNVIELLIPKKYHNIIAEKTKLNYAKPYQVEALKKDGSKITVELESKFLNYQGDNVRVTAIRDMTLKKQTEQILFKSEQNFKTLFNNSPLGIFTALPNGKIIDANQALIDILESPSIEATKEINILKFPLLIKNGFADDFKEVIKTGTTIKKEYHYTSKWGKTSDLWGHIVPLKNDKGEVYRVYVIIEDVTERKTIETELFKQKNLFETMFNSISDAAIITNTKREIILFNDATLKQFKYNNDEIKGKKTKILYEKPELYSEKGQEIFNKNSKKDSGTYITNYKDKNGKVFKGEVFGAKLVNKENKWIGNIGIIRDVSERIKMLDDLYYAKNKAEESDKLKTAFLNNLSHEIRTPMNSIIGFSQLLKKRNLNEEKKDSFVEKITNSSKQLLSIVDDIIKISKIESNQETVIIKEIDINSLLSDFYTIHKEQARIKNIELKITNLPKKNNCLVYSDINKLKQILNNLINNAVIYTKKGKIEFGCLKKDKILEFYVKDTGIGINKKMHKKIFDRFRQVEVETTREFGGLGLGLSISKSYAEMLGGKIWLESEPNKGTEFYFSIPILNNNTMENRNNKNEVINIKKPTVLIAEDDIFNYIFLEELLTKVNVNIIHAKNGIDAVEIYKTNKNIDLVFMDLKMPKLNGIEAIKQIRKISPNLPIIVQTAYAFAHDMETAFTAGCNDYLAKPILEKDFYKILGKYISLENN